MIESQLIACSTALILHMRICFVKGILTVIWTSTKQHSFGNSRKASVRLKWNLMYVDNIINESVLIDSAYDTSSKSAPCDMLLHYK